MLAPKESDLAWKRSILESTVQNTQNKSTKLASSSKSKELVYVTIGLKERIEEFVGHNLIVQNCKLFCLVCWESLSCKKSGIIHHI